MSKIKILSAWNQLLWILQCLQMLWPPVSKSHSSWLLLMGHILVYDNKPQIIQLLKENITFVLSPRHLIEKFTTMRSIGFLERRCQVALFWPLPAFVVIQYIEHLTRLNITKIRFCLPCILCLQRANFLQLKHLLSTNRKCFCYCSGVITIIFSTVITMSSLHHIQYLQN